MRIHIETMPKQTMTDDLNVKKIYSHSFPANKYYDFVFGRQALDESLDMRLFLVFCGDNYILFHGTYSLKDSEIIVHQY